MSDGHEQGNEPHHWRGTIRDIDPDVVYRSIRIAGGFRSWEDPPRTLYQVVTTTVEVHGVAGEWKLLISGATADRGAMLEICGSAGKGRTFPVIE